MSKTLNPLLENQELHDAHVRFAQSQTKAKYERIRAKYENINNEIVKEPKESEPTLYKMRMQLYPNLKHNIKVNLYVSALNTGKLKTVNQEKLKEYNIVFNGTKYVKA